MRILVVGAGIAGLAAARALTRAGQAVEVVERAAGPDRGGAGLYLPGNAVRALRRVGLDELAAEPIRAQRILDHRGRLLTDVDLPSFWGPAGPCVGMLRADLHRALAAGVRVGYGLEPVGLDRRPDAVTVRLSDGSRREVDLVVGADGIRSAVRGLLGDSRPPRRVGQLSWRFLVELAGVHAWTVLLGRGRSFLLVPVGGGRVYCYADATDAAPDQLHKLFAGFADPVPAALDRLADPYVGWIEEAPPARPAERVVLVGDAAHATAPNMAQGAAMAVEDALVLAEELGSADGSTARSARSATRWPRSPPAGGRGPTGSAIGRTAGTGPAGCPRRSGTRPCGWPASGSTAPTTARCSASRSGSEPQPSLGGVLGEQPDGAADAGAVVGAVAERVLHQVLLVVALGVVERPDRLDRRGDRPVAGVGQLLLERVPGRLGRRLLLLVGVVDRRPVLRADVVALPHPLRRVVRLPEHLQQLLVR